AEDPRKPQDPYPRVKALRETMREQGLADSVPIVMAGGVWRLDEWDHWIDNPELGQIIFQFGTRPLLTQESPIPPEWKARLLNLEDGDVLLHRFSPTGFYSSAVRNPFLRNLEARSDRQIAYTKESIGDHHFELDVGIGTKKNYWVTKGDLIHAREWFARGFTNAMKSPDDTLIFVTPQEEKQIRKDQAECMGCLSQCAFSSWADNEKNSTGRLADPRSFCIQKTLQDIAHGGPVEHNLMFAGHSAFRFKSDPFYSNWRLVEDPDGTRGWMLVSLLSDRRTAIVKPGAPRPIRVDPSDAAKPRYLAEPGVVGRISKCRDGWCRIEVGDREGYVRMAD